MLIVIIFLLLIIKIIRQEAQIKKGQLLFKLHKKTELFQTFRQHMCFLQVETAQSSQKEGLDVLWGKFDILTTIVCFFSATLLWNLLHASIFE